MLFESNQCPVHCATRTGPKESLSKSSWNRKAERRDHMDSKFPPAWYLLWTGQPCPSSNESQLEPCECSSSIAPSGASMRFSAIPGDCMGSCAAASHHPIRAQSDLAGSSKPPWPLLLTLQSLLQGKNPSGCSLYLLVLNRRKVNWGSQGMRRDLMEDTHVYKWNTQLHNGKAEFKMFVQ